MNRLIPSPSFHFITEFLGMSENSRWPPSRIQTGPSDHSNPSASLSKTAPGGTSASKRGSARSIWPNPGYVFASPPGTGWPLSSRAARPSRTEQYHSLVFIMAPTLAISGSYEPNPGSATPRLLREDSTGRLGRATGKNASGYDRRSPRGSQQVPKSLFADVPSAAERERQSWQTPRSKPR